MKTDIEIAQQAVMEPITRKKRNAAAKLKRQTFPSSTAAHFSRSHPLIAVTRAPATAAAAKETRKKGRYTSKRFVSPVMP